MSFERSYTTFVHILIKNSILVFMMFHFIPFQNMTKTKKSINSVDQKVFSLFFFLLFYYFVLLTTNYNNCVRTVNSISILQEMNLNPRRISFLFDCYSGKLLKQTPQTELAVERTITHHQFRIHSINVLGYGQVHPL